MKTDSPLAWGTVGWSDDGGSFYELGGGSNDANILVRVQLFRAKDSAEDLDASVGQGQRLLCKLASTFVQIPPRNTRVLVAIPEPFGMIPGGSMIIAADNPNPALIGNLKPGEAGVAAAEGDARVLLKSETDAIVLYTLDAGGKSVVVYVGSDKIQIGNSFGAITIDENGIRLTSGQAAVTLSPSGDARLMGQTASVTGSVASIAGKVGTMVGPNATAVTTALYGTSLSPIPSTSVFISP